MPVLSTDVSPPGGLSDHSLIVCQLNIGALNQHDTVIQYRRSWRSFDLDAFRADVVSSELIELPPTDDVDELFAVYHSTLSTLLDRHAPFRRRSISARRSEPWFDGECRAAKRLTRKLERAYRRRRDSATARTAWQHQFQEQRRLFRRKAEDYWRSTIAECRYDSRKLWCKLGLLLHKSEQQRPIHTAADLASHFVAKVDQVRARTANADPPTVVRRLSEKLSDFQPVTVEEIRKLVTKAPSKHCQLDPIPVWLLKQVVDQLAPVLTVMCNTSLTTGKLPSAEKHALVTARLKKPTLDLTDLNSYRPISNLSFTSKLVERCVAARFVAHCEQNRLFLLIDAIIPRRRRSSLFTVTLSKRSTEGSSRRSSYWTSARRLIPWTIPVS